MSQLFDRMLPSREAILPENSLISKLGFSFTSGQPLADRAELHPESRYPDISRTYRLLKIISLAF